MIAMLQKHTIIHIMDSCDKILFNREDANIIHLILESSSEDQVNRCYRAYLNEIARQCRI
jgi:hypothetical protein